VGFQRTVPARGLLASLRVPVRFVLLGHCVGSCLSSVHACRCAGRQDPVWPRVGGRSLPSLAVRILHRGWRVVRSCPAGRLHQRVGATLEHMTW